MFAQLIAIQILLSLNTLMANPLIGNTDMVKAALPKEFPFVVSIGLKVLGRGHFCTGTLIDRSHVLTAAHCFKNIGRPRNVRVLVGTNDLTNINGGKLHRVSSAGWTTFDEWAKKTNENYTSRYNWNDIAIVKLMSEVRGDIPMPIISQKTDEEHYGQTVVTAGWGYMKDDVKPNLLQKTTLKVISRTECEDKMVEAGYPKEDVGENELCSFANASVLLGCGDSGGPLLVNGNELIGVNEAVCEDEEMRPTQTFNLHISVDYYRDFIRAIDNRV